VRVVQGPHWTSEVLDDGSECFGVCALLTQVEISLPLSFGHEGSAFVGEINDLWKGESSPVCLSQLSAMGRRPSQGANI
jgi:hypothetical protein